CDENSCRLVGTAENSGAGCASEVIGTTSFCVLGEQVARFTVPTSVQTQTVYAGSSFEFSGDFNRKKLTAILPTDWYSTTAFEWRNVACPSAISAQAAGDYGEFVNGP